MISRRRAKGGEKKSGTRSRHAGDGDDRQTISKRKGLGAVVLVKSTLLRLSPHNAYHKSFALAALITSSLIVAAIAWIRRSKLVVRIVSPYGTVYGEHDDLTVGRSCSWDQHREWWVCQDCGTADGNDECKRLQPRGRCTKFGRPGWDVPRPRSSSSHDPTATKYPLMRTLTHYGLENTFYHQAVCQVSLPCFDLSRCAGEGPTRVYSHGSSSSVASKLLDHATKEIPQYVTRVSDPADACLLVVAEGSYNKYDELVQSDLWNGGKNHYVWWNVTMFPGEGLEPLARPFDPFNYGMAAVATWTLSDAHAREGFDTPIALFQKWNRDHNFGELGLHRPRRLLLSFKGNIEPWEQVYWQHRWIASEYWDESDSVFVDVKCKINVRTKKNVPENHVHYKFPTDRTAYGELLLNSTFVFAPGGGSVSSYRFTEALSAGAIPVVTSEYLPPFFPEVDWSGCLVRVSEARVIDLPRLLREISTSEVRQRQSSCASLFRSVLGEEKKGDGFWGHDGGKAQFITAMKIWDVRIKIAKQRDSMLKKFKAQHVS